MSAPKIFGWYYSTRGDMLHYFQWGKSLCQRVPYSTRAIESLAGHENARLCRACADRAQNKPQKPEPRQSRLFG